MDVRDLDLAFRTLREGIVEADQIHELMTECLERGDTSFSVLLAERGWASLPEAAATEAETSDPSTVEETGLRPAVVAADVETTDGSDNATTQALPTENWDSRQSRPIARGVERPDPESRYDRIKVHGIGGLGRVWLARDRHLGREVALKEVRDDRAVDPGQISRFLDARSCRAPPA